ncbi:hypothetical protein IAI18_15275 [Acetobacteraceae bacterium H6797]|nr:hypothetical protein [Acetobacteraceae bacterium H6797]
MADPVGAIAFYGAATRRWLERDTPDVAEALRTLAQLLAHVQRASSVIHEDITDMRIRKL